MAVVIVLAIGGPFLYIHVIEGSAPAKLSLPAATTTSPSAKGSSSGTGTPGATADKTTAATTSLTGTWRVAGGSVAGYRVDEVLIGQHTTAVGRTSAVSGTLVVDGAVVRSATFSVKMATVKSDQSERNAQFDGPIMDVARYPTATFVLSSPISLGSSPAIGKIVTVAAVGKLSLHGVTRKLPLTISVEHTGTDTFEVLTDATIVFSDFDIANPSIGGFVTTASKGTLEVLLHLVQGSASDGVTSTTTLGGGSSGPGQVTIPATTVPPLSISKKS